MPCFPNSLLDGGSSSSFARSSSAEANRDGHSALLRILNNDSIDALREFFASRPSSASVHPRTPSVLGLRLSSAFAFSRPCNAQQLIRFHLFFAENLKGIGKERAKKVVEYRTSVKIAGRDAFSNVSDLSQVGMNAKSIARFVEENNSASTV